MYNGKQDGGGDETVLNSAPKSDLDLSDDFTLWYVEGIVVMTIKKYYHMAY